MFIHTSHDHLNPAGPSPPLVASLLSTNALRDSDFGLFGVYLISRPNLFKSIMAGQPEIPRYDEDEFMERGREIFLRNKGGAKETDHRRFKVTFGTTPTICTIIWDLLLTTDNMPQKGRPEHLLWALLFLHLYCAESVHATLTGHDEKTFRKWSWTFVRAISYLQADVVRPSSSHPNTLPNS